MHVGLVPLASSPISAVGVTAGNITATWTVVAKVEASADTAD